MTVDRADDQHLAFVEMAANASARLSDANETKVVKLRIRRSCVADDCLRCRTTAGLLH